MKRIIVSNYKNIGHAEFIPEKVNILVGKTGAGKSSVLEAILKCMSGSITPDAIRYGEQKASVAITFDDGVTVERRRTASAVKCYIDGKPNSVKAANAYIEKTLGVPIGAISSMEGVPYFSGKSGKDIGALLYKILPLSMNVDKVIELAGDELGALSDDEETALRSAFGDAVTVGDKELVKARKTLYDERTAVNAGIRKLKALVSQPYTLPSESQDVLHKRLEEIALEEEKAKAYSSKLAEYQRQQAARSRIEAQVRNINAQLAQMESVKEPDLAREAQCQQELAQMRAMLQNESSASAQCDAIIASDTQTLSGLQSGKCPLSAGITCLTDLSGTIQAAAEHMEKAKARKAQADSKISKISALIKSREDELSAIANQKTSWARKKVLLDQATALVVPPEPEKPEEAKLMDYAEEKRMVFENLRAYTVADEVKKFKADLEKEEEKSVLLERLISALDEKGGIRTAILKKVLTPFEQACSDKASKFRDGFKVRFSCDDGLDILIQTHDGMGYRSLETASTGEFLFVSYMLMSVISQVTNPGFMILDGLDALDAETLGNFLEIVKNDNTVQHFFCATVDHSDTLSELARIGANVVNI